MNILKEKNVLRPIVDYKKAGQEKVEIKNAMVSILIFALQAIPLQILYQHGAVQFAHTGTLNLLWEIPVLFLWNEIYFYASHWLLHRKWFFMKVHYKHHESREPTLYSVYSFHWFEAFLLGAVIFIPILVYSFHIISILSLPIMSILLNFLGHWNHETETSKNPDYLGRFTFRHTMHHKWSKGNFGFMLPYLDMCFKTTTPKNKMK
ncbi:sterol desaturase family protein [Maribacter sp. ANRC-HE7]|uniref:Sterol desaturase family protein n=1 Tax=Maribacter aquimaris TaxID=2737171 RepID=A0ABR7V2E1_9FLAO|nr:sterol desaturase family protein [Maribacter aquimaris]MBD0778084.1 sterol desaturase family protein [Maribacter aquimaris]